VVMVISNKYNSNEIYALLMQIIHKFISTRSSVNVTDS